MTIKAIDRHTGYEHPIIWIDFKKRQVATHHTREDPVNPETLDFDEVFLQVGNTEINLWEVE